MMNAIPHTTPLDLLHAPLEGMNLIEASAGTGKTHTITGFYLRLVLEANYTVDQILVVTYTKAATAELKDRIHTRLSVLRAAIESDDRSDSFCPQLLAHFPDRTRALRRVVNAIQGFDQAAIYTIHGFCQRVLTDHAFESAMPFETEVLPDDLDVLRRIVEDFWRREFYQGPPLFVDYVQQQRLCPETLLAWARPHVAKPYLRILAPTEAPAHVAYEQAFVNAYAHVKTLWQSHKAEVWRLLTTHPALNRNRYPQQAVAAWLSAMDDYLRGEWPRAVLFEGFERFTPATLAASVKKGMPPPSHAFFSACGGLQQSADALHGLHRQHLGILKRRLLDYCNTELMGRKRELRAQSYDDLLLNLERALSGQAGSRLSQVLQGRYRAALVDEFQDTDPIQFGIFQSIYGGTRCPVFLVGDPKQAIYGFRGADVFTYLRAHRIQSQAYTLYANWRSHPDLIHALNVLFENNTQPFLIPEIAFSRATPASVAHPSLRISGELGPPLHLWFLKREDGQRLITKADAAQRIASATANEVARLLTVSAQGQAHIGAKPVTGGDIAVLVRNHRQAQILHDQLMAVGVPSVRHSHISVLHTPQAAQVERLALAVAEPWNEQLVIAALITDLLGVKGGALYRITQDESVWSEYLETFHAWHRLWRDHGFVRMFWHVLECQGVPKRLLSAPDGERQLTNVLHLAELLHAASCREHLSMEGLVKWLSERRQKTTIDIEEEQLRLESDEHLVRIVTVHKSKGLEYPIVFCPFLWDSRPHPALDGTFAFHDPRDNFRPVLAISEEGSVSMRRWAEREEFAENLRLLYVALTRAKLRCYVAWGAIRDARGSALAWLLHPPRDSTRAEHEPSNGARFEGLDDDALMAELGTIVARSGGTVQLACVSEQGPQGTPLQPATDGGHSLSARVFSGHIKVGPQITSFSALTNHQGKSFSDHHEASVITDTDPLSSDTRDIFSFPRGAQAGDCLHSLFQRLDFTARDPGKHIQQTQQVLTEHGFEEAWTPVIVDTIDKVLATPLDRDKTLRLHDLPWARRLNEVEFCYPLAEYEVSTWYQFLAAYRRAHLPSSQGIHEYRPLASVGGFMKGFIDLVFESRGQFYIVDYKSNWLGPTCEAYAHACLPEVMVRECYDLQYLIYTVALHRYLRHRVPGYHYERHFGGVFYLFLRGMHPALGAAAGVFAARPEREWIEALDASMETGTPATPI